MTKPSSHSGENPSSVAELNKGVASLVGQHLADIEVLMGEIDLSFAPGKQRITISSVNWLLTSDGQLVASSFSDQASARITSKFKTALLDKLVVSASVSDARALNLGFESGTNLVTLPLADWRQQLRFGENQWWLDLSNDEAIFVSNTGHIEKTQGGMPEIDYLYGHSAAERRLLERAVDYLSREFGARIITDGRIFGSSDVILVDNASHDFVMLGAKAGRLRKVDLDRFVAQLSNKYSPSFEARPVLAVPAASPEILGALRPYRQYQLLLLAVPEDGEAVVVEIPE